MGKLIVIEGMDGAGKSTVSGLLSKLLNNREYSTINMSSVFEGFLTSAKYVNDNCGVDAHYLYFLSSVKHCSDTIEKKLAHGNVVCDRYIYSTIAYHPTSELSVSVDISTLELVQPDFTFYLSVSDESIRQERLNNRAQRSVSDRLIKTKGSYMDTVEKAYEELGLVTIDCTTKTAQKIAEELFVVVEAKLEKVI
ncbi:dTMP kinase [Granulosicoccus antarcticus]|uniref:Thymidylate kinase n=1 Tax=Granulosicoccus antarcticus IMCC3135 TaxID=1192854 RepID=A0A2Z2NX06_9GAMM|nr:dTMP kinase [Granulosicoccus antarcticus]ASJ75773.1 Thymidylate kinase [Granulosicoccus antarcticus IMCC3135]